MLLILFSCRDVSIQLLYCMTWWIVMLLILFGCKDVSIQLLYCMTCG